MTDQLQFPYAICAPAACTPTHVTPPFGLPPVTIPDPCCTGLDLPINQLGQLISPLYPFLQVIDCVFKVFSILKDIGDILTSLPVPPVAAIKKLTDDLAALVPCAVYIGGLIPGSPIMALQVLCLIKGMIKAIVVILTCVKSTIKVQVQMASAAVFCAASGDPALEAQGICLQAQVTSQAETLLAQLSFLNNIMSTIALVVNIVVSAIPGLSKALSDAGINLGSLSIDVSVPITDVAEIDAILVILNDLLLIITPFAVGCP